MKVTKTNQLEKARNLCVGEIAVVEFDDYDKYRSFLVQLTHYNAGKGRKKNLYVHAASKKEKLQYCLIVVSSDEHLKEMSNSNLKNEWKKQIPKEWGKA